MRRWTKNKLAAFALLATSVFATLAMDGCAGGYASYTYATVPPPPIRVETYGPVPGPGYIWIQGYWGYRDNGYFWVPGRWNRPPLGRHEWRPGYWEDQGGRHRWHEGQWR